MKTCFVIAAFVLFVAVQAELTHEHKEKVHAMAKECIAETKADPEEVKKLKDGEDIDTDGVKDFAKCFYEKLGIWKDGELQHDAAVEKLSHVIDKDKAEEIIQECSKESGSDERETIFKMMKCGSEKVKKLL